MTMLAVAHRAGNDPAALRAAMAAGADVVETDVHLRDGRLELHHLTALGPLPWSLDQRRRRLWRLVPDTAPRWGLAELLDVLGAARPRPRVLLDLKGEATGPPVAEPLRQRRPDRALACGSWPAVQAVAEVPGVAAIRSAGTRAELDDVLSTVRAGRPPDGVSVRLGLLGVEAGTDVGAQVVRELRAAVEHVLAWPVNGRRGLDRARALGVTAVITDDAAVLRAVTG